MVEKFQRPEVPIFPQIYRKFTANNFGSDELVEYHVQDLTDQYVEQTIEMVLKFLTTEETLQRSINLAERDFAPKILGAFYGSVVKERTSLGCFKTATMEMVGVNALVVKTKGQKEKIKVKNYSQKFCFYFRSSKQFQFEQEDFTMMMNAFDYLTEKFDVFEHYKVDYYLSGVGMCVNSDYRARGIATELLKARAPLLKSLGLTVTSTLFTSIGSQKAAARSGYDEKASTSYEELHEKFPKLDFSHANTPVCKTLALKID